MERKGSNFGGLWFEAN